MKYEEKPGIAFGDFISTEKIRRRKSEDSGNTSIRNAILLLLVFVAMSLIVVRLVNLQVVKGEYYGRLAEANRTKTAVIHAPRGIILDRNGVPLVYNIPGFRKTVNGKVQFIAAEEAIERLSKGEKGLEVDNLRQYPYKEETAHVLGFIGQIDDHQLREEKYKDYTSGDIIGKDGIENQYESLLRGKSGKELIEVNNMGGEVRKLGREDPIAGRDTKITLDIKLQQAAYEAARNVKKGAVIATNTKGEVLAMISKPSFDPNIITLDKTYMPASGSAYLKISDILGDGENQPLLNRAIGGVYPPGSTFKLITAAAGLEGKIIDENSVWEDTGIFYVGSFSFANWYFTQYGKTEGEVNITKAVARSNDIFFYRLAGEIGVERLSEEARKFGLGKPLGIDLSGEKGGIVPTSSWKKEEIGDPWYLGDTYHYGIGQGYLLTTPLQVNGWTQAIANGGFLFRPHLLMQEKAELSAGRLLSKESLELIREGMINSCSPGGVAWPLFEFRIKNKELRIDGKNFLEVPESTTSGSLKEWRKVTVACKTGTSQHGDEKELPHAWITLFAPAYNPEIIITVLSESSGEGSNVAAPIAKKILEEYFTSRN